MRMKKQFLRIIKKRKAVTWLSMRAHIPRMEKENPAMNFSRFGEPPLVFIASQAVLSPLSFSPIHCR